MIDIHWKKENTATNIKINNYTITLHQNKNMFKSVITDWYVTKGKYYFEITLEDFKNDIDYGPALLVGICDENFSISNSNIENDINQVSYFFRDSSIFPNRHKTQYVNELRNNDTLCVSVDMDNKEVIFAKNGEYLSKESFIFNRVYIFAQNWGYGYSVFNSNFGQYEFKYPVPKGYVAFNKNKYTYLLKQNNKYYSINEEFYDKENKVYLSCNRDFKKNGIENLSLLLEEKSIDLLKGEKGEINFNKINIFNIDNNFKSLISLKENNNTEKQYSNNIIPEMTSNNDNDIELKCSSIYSTSYDVFGLFDRGNENEGKKSWATTNGTTEGWIEIKFNKKTNISKCTFESRTGHGFVKEELPSQWILLASNNGKFLENGKENEDYYIIDKREDNNVWKEHETREYLFFNNCEFLYYRFYFKTPKENKSWVCIDNIEVMSLKDEFKYKFLIKQQEKYYTIKNNKLEQIKNNNSVDTLFNENGFYDFYLINQDILLSKFNDFSNVRIIAYNKQVNSNITLQYELDKHFKPINCFKGEIELVQAEEK